MNIDKCPKCGGEVKATVNAHAKTRVAHCAKCGRLVTLGKIEVSQTGSGEGAAGGKKAGEKKQARPPKGKKSQKTKAAPSAHSNPADPKLKRSAAGSAGAGPTFSGFLRDFFG